MSLRDKFKKTGNTPPPAPQKKLSSYGYSIYKSGIAETKFEQGDNSIRFLPQFNDSQFADSVDIRTFGIWDGTGKRGTLRVDEQTGDPLLRRVNKLLRAHPKYQFLLKQFNKLSKEDEAFIKELLTEYGLSKGLDLQSRPRVILQGFNYLDKDRTVNIYQLPGTNPFPTKDGSERKRQAGSQVQDLCYLTDITGKLINGNVFDIETGSVVTVKLTGTGLSTAYTVSANAKLPVTEDAVLEQIRDWGDVLVEPNIVDLVEALQGLLPPEVFEFVDGNMHLTKYLKQDEQDQPY